MSTCGSSYKYEDGSGLIICPECGFEWSPAEQAEVIENAKSLLTILLLMKSRSHGCNQAKLETIRREQGRFFG
jgi:hypothetical protein